MAEKLFHVGVKALITNDAGQILVFDANVQNFKFPGDATPHSDLPGGRINDDGETLLQALKREVLEETGITEIEKITFMTAVMSGVEIPISATEKVGLLLMVYKVTVPNDSKIIMSDEHISYEWVSVAEAKKRLAYKFTSEFTDLLE